MRKLLLILLALSAGGCLVLCGARPWFQIPTAEDGGGLLIRARDLGITLAFQRGTLALAGMAITSWLLVRRSNPATVILVTSSLLLTLAFPFAVLACEAPTAARAAWLQMQHENLCWLGGDIYRSREYKDLPSQMRMFVADSPRQVMITDLPTWSVSELRLTRLPTLVDWLGYNNTFCQFFGAGWALAVTGTGLLLLTCLFRHWQLDVRLVQIAVRSLVIGGLVLVGLMWVRPFAASRAVASAAEATHRGQHDVAIRYLEEAADLWPPLRQDTWYLSQRGLLERHAGYGTLLARLQIAKEHERMKQRDLAESEYLAIAADDASAGPLRREACRGLMRQGIHALNSAEVHRAERQFRRVLHFDPCSLKALYGLQLASLQLGNRDTLSTACHQFNAVYDSLRFPDKKIVLAAADEMFCAGDPTADNLALVKP